VSAEIQLDLQANCVNRSKSASCFAESDIPARFIRAAYLESSDNDTWRLIESLSDFAAALAIPDLATLILSAYCSGIRVDFQPPASVVAASHRPT
jgi:hypothetical protein